MFTIVGNTEDKKIVLSGVSNFISTHGLPLEFVLEILERDNYRVSWPHFIEEMMANGASKKTIMNRILTAVGDVYGSAYKTEFEPILKGYLNTIAT